MALPAGVGLEAATTDALVGAAALGAAEGTFFEVLMVVFFGVWVFAAAGAALDLVATGGAALDLAATGGAALALL